jgi:hypothetical protein
VVKKTVPPKRRAPPLIEELGFKLALFMADIAKRFIPGFATATKGRLIPGSGKVTIRTHYGHGTLGEQTGIGVHGHLQWTVLLKWLRSYTGKDTVTFKLLVLMTPVTERFVMGAPTTAERNLSALLEQITEGIDDFDLPGTQQWTINHTLHYVFITHYVLSSPRSVHCTLPISSIILLQEKPEIHVYATHRYGKNHQWKRHQHEGHETDWLAGTIRETGHNQVGAGTDQASVAAETGAKRQRPPQRHQLFTTSHCLFHPFYQWDHGGDEGDIVNDRRCHRGYP